jgi:hypothetical protein
MSKRPTLARRIVRRAWRMVRILLALGAAMGPSAPPPPPPPPQASAQEAADPGAAPSEER